MDQEAKKRIERKRGLIVVAISLVAGVLIVMSVDDPPTNRQPTVAPVKVTQLNGLGNFAAVIDPKTPAQSLPAVARTTCAGQTHCSVYGWIDPAFAATAVPLTDRELSALAYKYDLNRDTGLDQSIWNCRLFKGVEERSCLG